MSNISRPARFSARSAIRSDLSRLTAIAAALLICASAQAQTRVRLALGWLPQADFGGYFAAKADGLYSAKGLDVDIVPGNSRNGAIMLLATGAYDFVNIFNSGVALDVANVHLPYVVIAAIYQNDPTAIIVHDAPDAPENLAALRDYPIMISPEALDNYWAFLQTAFHYSNRQIRRYTGDSTLFVSDAHMAQQGYLTNDVPRLKDAGVPIRAFPLFKAGYGSYGPLIVARRTLVEQHPEIVQKFLDATIEGWCHYLHANRQAADRLIIAGNPDYQQRNAENAVAAQNHYGLIEGGDAARDGIGTMTLTRWKAYLDQMRPTGLYPPDMNLSTVYTTRFLHHMRCTPG